MSSMDRRTVLTAVLGVCAVAGGLGAVASTAAAVPKAAPPSPLTGEVVAEAAEGEATLQNAQYIVFGRRRRRRVFVRRYRRRRRYYF